MVRVRANESVRLAVAKQINTQNKGRKTSNPPTRKKIGGGETPNAPSQNEIMGRETPNPPSPRVSESSISNAKANTKRRKTQNGGKALNPPPHKEIGGEETLNPPSQREMVGGETSNSSPPREETGGGRETVTIDTELLDCSICTNPLCPPLYQCMNGHVTCPSCWSKVQHKCHICNTPVVTRNIALEAVLESVHLPCRNANFGCRQSVSYSQMQLHTDTCEFGPFLCPIPGCSHKASSEEWREHFIKDHWDTVHHCYDFDGRYDFDGPYNYGASWPIIFNDEDLEEDRYCSFLGPGKDVFLLVKEAIRNGNALSFYYIDLPDLGPNYFECKLRVQGGPLLSRSLPLELRSYHSRSLQSGSRVVSIKEWKRGEVHGSSLLVQSQFLWERHMRVNILLDKKKLYSR